MSIPVNHFKVFLVWLRLFNLDSREAKFMPSMMIQVEQSQPNKKDFKMIPEVSIDNGFIKTLFLESMQQK
jgi:hypothetical protein